MSDHRKVCAACGADGELHKHHLIPQVHGGRTGPTVMLCIPCHSEVHGRDFAVDHRALTIAGLERARARGVKLGVRSAPNGFDGERARKGREASSVRAAAYFAALAPHLDDAERAGCRTQREYAVFLKARRVPTPRGGTEWHISMVQRGLKHRNGYRPHRPDSLTEPMRSP